MADVDHVWGQDINVSPSGDLGAVDGATLGQQRIIRRIMTAADRVDAFRVKQPGEYIFHPGYGASVPQSIGDAANGNSTRARIRRQIFKERAVAAVPQPQVTTTVALNTVSVAVKYADANTGLQAFLSFDASNK